MDILYRLRRTNKIWWLHGQVLKDFKKPLKFVMTKKIDRDDVPRLSIVKKIHMRPAANNPNELILCNDDDCIYFS